MEARNAEYLEQAHELLRRVELTTDDDETEDALAAVIQGLETVMSDKFDLHVS